MLTRPPFPLERQFPVHHTPRMSEANGQREELLALQIEVARLRGDLQAVGRLIEHTLARAGITTIEGLTVEEWARHQRNLALHRYMMELEKRDRGLAAQVEAQLRAGGYLSDKR